MGELAVSIDGIGQAVIRSFEKWGKNHSRYSKLYRSLTDEILEVAHTALPELQNPRYKLKPGGWEVWWAENHNRFIRRKGVRQRELLHLHELMYHFLTAFARGELERQNDEPKKGVKKVSKRAKAEA